MGKPADLTIHEHDWLRGFVKDAVSSVEEDREFPKLLWPDGSVVDPDTTIFKLCQLYLFERKHK